MCMCTRASTHAKLVSGCGWWKWLNCTSEIPDVIKRLQYQWGWVWYVARTHSYSLHSVWLLPSFKINLQLQSCFSGFHHNINDNYTAQNCLGSTAVFLIECRHSIKNTAVYPRTFWASYLPPWELEISDNYAVWNCQAWGWNSYEVNLFSIFVSSVCYWCWHWNGFNPVQSSGFLAIMFASKSVCC
jgi:hypothetical protein